MPGGPRVRDYFVEREGPSAAEVEGTLWNADVTADDLNEAGEHYLIAVLEQYKLYVELTDRVSLRRGVANTFFLTLNLAAVSVTSAAWSRDALPPAGPAGVATAVLLMLCLIWFWVVRSYRQLNTCKWAVIGAFERRLPASPWWNAEWQAMKEGRDPARYWPLSHIEQWVPLLFALAYLAGFAFLVTS